MPDTITARQALDVCMWQSLFKRGYGLRAVRSGVQYIHQRRLPCNIEHVVDSYLGSRYKARSSTENSLVSMNLIKAFLYKNDCALCVWARYCLFFLIGVQVHTKWPGPVTTAISAVVALLLIFFVVLSLIPEKGEVEHIIKGKDENS